MRFLLDTHALLWMLDEPDRLRSEARLLLQDPENDVLFSPVSIYEALFKVAIGKLPTPPRDPYEAARASGYEVLSITAEHAQLAATLPLHHRDPFDRILIAQAMLDGLTLMSRDGIFPDYGVALLSC